MKYSAYRVGTIVEIRDSSDGQYKYITIAKDVNDVYTFTKLVYSDQTLILDCEYNEIPVESLQLGDVIVAYHSNRMTMSIPPQTTVYIIEVKS